MPVVKLKTLSEIIIIGKKLFGNTLVETSSHLTI